MVPARGLPTVANPPGVSYGRQRRSVGKPAVVRKLRDMYQRPCDASVSRGGSFTDHVNRDPTSPEPGTDYACGRGTDIHAADAGKVVQIKTTNTGLMGRFVAVALDDGNTVRYLHLSEVRVGVGARVSRGDVIARSGASGKGSETKYDPHVHTTLWIGTGQFGSAPVDFELHAGGPTLAGFTVNVEEDDMLALKIGFGSKEFLCALGPGVFRHFIASDPVDFIMRLMRAQDDWQSLDISALPALLRTYGCDLNIWDIRDGDFAVLDPLDGSVKAGNMWSSAGAVRAAIAGLISPALDNSGALEEGRRIRRVPIDPDLDPDLQPVDELPPPGNLF